MKHGVQRSQVIHKPNGVTPRGNEIKGALMRPGNRGRHGDLPYYIVTHGTGTGLGADFDKEFGSGPATAAQIHCISCPAHIEEKMKSGQAMNMHHIVKAFEEKKWVHLGAVRWRCPPCEDSHRHSAKGESPKDPVAIERRKAEAVLNDERERSDMRRIARALDAFWDHAERRYLMGMDDGVVARELGVDVLMVQRVRAMDKSLMLEEGTIDREILSLRAVVAGNTQEIAAMFKRMAELEMANADVLSRLGILEKRKPVTGELQAQAVEKGMIR